MRQRHVLNAIRHVADGFVHDFRTVLRGRGGSFRQRPNFVGHHAETRAASTAAFSARIFVLNAISSRLFSTPATSRLDAEIAFIDAVRLFIAPVAF